FCCFFSCRSRHTRFSRDWSSDVCSSDSIERAADDQGVVVLMDLGSAILSAQTALEFLDPELEGRVTLTFAPLVEGLVGAVVTAAAGADADAVAGQAEIAVEAKRLQLGV